jgi:hypothetical protein
LIDEFSGILLNTGAAAAYTGSANLRQVAAMSQVAPCFGLRLTSKKAKGRLRKIG